MKNPMSLEGRRILITGASSGIGRACATLAAELGASVILVARRTQLLSEVRASLANPERHNAVPCDISDSQSVAELVARIGKLDGLVHAAGVGPACPIGFVGKEAYESVFKINYYSFLELMKFYSKAKYRNDRFSVVAISSVAALSGWSGVSVYGGSKGALSASVRALAWELAPKGVRVNAVCPSNIKTPMYESAAVALNDEESLKALLSKQPLGLGEPEQVASAVAFLLSDAASFITGVNLPVDGGYLAQ